MTQSFRELHRETRFPDSTLRSGKQIFVALNSNSCHNIIKLEQNSVFETLGRPIGVTGSPPSQHFRYQGLPRTIDGCSKCLWAVLDLIDFV
jgi:hypothetical protein